jgi:hypothetical protein
MKPCIANIFLSTTNEMQRYTMLFIVVSALHVSSGFSAHHQELKNCVCSIGTYQTCVLLSLAWLSRNWVAWPFRVEVGKDLHTKRSPTQSDIHQMYWYNWFSWWWARGCSKYVGNWNKYIEKNRASSWSFTKNPMKMHGQQNLKLYSLSTMWGLRFHCGDVT